jgi:hypothetical protein
MMKNVSRSARPMITWVGGIWLVPMAFRTMESTMTMRVKEVARMRMDGASESTVISTRSCTPVLTCFGSPPSSTERVTPGASHSEPAEQAESARARRASRSRIKQRVRRAAFRMAGISFPAWGARPAQPSAAGG